MQNSSQDLSKTRPKEEILNLVSQSLANVVLGFKYGKKLKHNFMELNNTNVFLQFSHPLTCIGKWWPENLLAVTSDLIC